MTRFIRFALLSALATVFAAAQDLPKAETILDRYVEATGGKAAYEKHSHETMTGTISIPGPGLTGSLTRYAMAPDKEYSVLQLGPLGKAESGFSNGVAWEKNAITGPRIKSGAEKEQAAREARFNAQVDWRKSFSKAETIGSESVNGEDCYKVVVTPPIGKPQTQYYSKKSGLLMKTTATAVNPMGEVMVEVEVSDYKDFDRVLYPTRSKSKMGPQQMDIVITGMNFDQAIPAEFFELPAEIKALVEKAAAK